MPCTRRRAVLDRTRRVLVLLLGLLDLMLFSLAWRGGAGEDWFGRFFVLAVGLHFLSLVTPCLWPVLQRHGIHCVHVFERDQDGHTTLERQWRWRGRLLKRQAVDLPAYSWLRVKATDFTAVTLELGNPGYQTHALEVVRPLGRNRFLPEEIEDDKARLVALAATIARWTGIENRGFREHA